MDRMDEWHSILRSKFLSLFVKGGPRHRNFDYVL